MSEEVKEVAISEKKTEKTKASAKKIEKKDKKENDSKDAKKNFPKKINQDELSVDKLQKKKISELYAIAKDLNIEGMSTLEKHDLIFKIVQAKGGETESIKVTGILDTLPDGYGFMRTNNYLPSNDDVYVSNAQIKKFSLMTGDVVSGEVRKPKDNEKYFSLIRITTINGESIDKAKKRTYFNNLTPVFPDTRIDLECDKKGITARLINMIAPIGFGQRALLVSPPKAGKTTILKDIAHAIEMQYPNVLVKVLLIDERPEEVTDMARSVRGEVVASTFDEPPEQHVKVSELVLESAKRQMEYGKDVVILLDSITRLARAHNLVVSPSGRTLSGGLDPASLHKPKRFFGAARNIEDGGSLTIIATALVDTGSRMDDVIYEEFKGTGNMELHLDRKLANRRIYPAIDILSSGTRKEELMLDPEQLRKTTILRKSIDSENAVEELIKLLKQTDSNEEFFNSGIFG